MDTYPFANGRPVVQPFCIFDPQVDTATAHGCPKIMMPVCAMKAILIIKEHHPGNIWYLVVRT